MTQIQPYAGLLMCVLVCTSCRPNITARGYGVPGTNGIAYSCEVVEPQRATLFSRKTPLVVLVSRVGGGLKEYPMRWESKAERIFVDGKLLDEHGDVPVVYYKEDGQLRTLRIPGMRESPAWNVFLTGNRPTEKELARVFEALGESKKSP